MSSARTSVVDLDELRQVARLFVHMAYPWAMYPEVLACALVANRDRLGEDFWLCG